MCIREGNKAFLQGFSYQPAGASYLELSYPIRAQESHESVGTNSGLKWSKSNPVTLLSSPGLN